MAQQFIFNDEQVEWIAEQAQFKVMELWEASCELEDLHPGGDLYAEFEKVNMMVDLFIGTGHKMYMDEEGNFDDSHVVETSYASGRATWKSYQMSGEPPHPEPDKLPRTEYNYATFIDKESQEEFRVDISPALAEWLYAWEDEKETIFMAWNDALKVLEREITAWEYHEIHVKGHLLNLRDELQQLAIHEDNE